jgi:hypothetical protein
VQVVAAQARGQAGHDERATDSVGAVRANR